MLCASSKLLFDDSYVSLSRNQGTPKVSELFRVMTKLNKKTPKGEGRYNQTYWFRGDSGSVFQGDGLWFWQSISCRFLAIEYLPFKRSPPKESCENGPGGDFEATTKRKIVHQAWASLPGHDCCLNILLSSFLKTLGSVPDGIRIKPGVARGLHPSREHRGEPAGPGGSPGPNGVFFFSVVFKGSKNDSSSLVKSHPHQRPRLWYRILIA